MNKFYYVTVASGDDFIKKYTIPCVKSLIRTGISPKDIHFIGRSKSDIRLFASGVPEVNVYRHKVDLSPVCWRYCKGRRKYSYFRAIVLHKVFPKPIPNRHMVCFDGDVLFYKDPTEFLKKRCQKTWFWHGKELIERSIAGRSGKTTKDINVKSYKSLSTWCSEPQAHLMVKWGAKVVPKREVCCGFYVLHPNDHEGVIRVMKDGVIEIRDKFCKHSGAGDQKPMNAALAVCGVDWHGGLKFDCPEHLEYFDLFLNSTQGKKDFVKQAQKMGLY